MNPAHKSLFIHIPKCGGTSMECGGIPWSRGDGHNTLTDYLLAFPGCHAYFKWTFVRNPYDRIASCWASIYRVHERMPNHKAVVKWTPLMRKYRTINDTFYVFLEMLYAEREKLQELDGLQWCWMPPLKMPYTRVHFFPMVSLLRHKGKLGMDFVGKVEDIGQGWGKVCDAFGQFVPLSTQNAHKKKFGIAPSYDEMLNQRSARKMVGEIYKEDFEAFEYAAS